MGDLSPVIDKTGLVGTYDFVIEYGRNSSPSSDGSGVALADESGPTLLEALREQLGLKLVPTTGPIDVLLVDRVEQPSEN